MREFHDDDRRAFSAQMNWNYLYQMASALH